MNKRRWLGLVGLGALAVVVILNLDRFGQLAGVLRQIRWYVLVLVVMVQLFSYFCNAKYYQSFLAIFGYQLAWRRLWQIAVAINFVNQVFPSGGISGVSFLAGALKGEVPYGKATLTQLIRYIFTYISYLIVLTLGFVLLLLLGGINQGTVRVMLLLIIVIIVGNLIIITAVADRPRVESLVSWIVRLANRIAGKIRRKRTNLITAARLKEFLNEFYHGYQLLLEERGHWTKPLLYCLGGNLAEVLTIYAVFLAFGNFVNLGVVIAAYTLANIASLLGLFTGGAGIYEATMIGTLVALGQPLTISFSVVLVYRVFNMGLFLPFGFHYYRKYV